MEIFVINLESALDRRQHIIKEFEKKNVNFKFFKALTPNVALSLVQEMGLNYEEYITKGELACFMSHLSLWKKMIDENIPYMAVFEDDIYLGENAGLYLNASNWIKPNWDIIKLEAFFERIFLSSKSERLADRRHIAHLKGRNYGTAGYILSLNGAKELFSFLEDNINIPLDHFMFEKFVLESDIPVYQINPALCIQDMILHHRCDQAKSTLPSMLINERGMRMKAEQKTSSQKLKRELKRILDKIISFLFAKKITFR